MLVTQALAATFLLLKSGQVVISTIALDSLHITKFKEVYLLARSSEGTATMVSDFSLSQNSSALENQHIGVEVESLPLEKKKRLCQQ